MNQIILQQIPDKLEHKLRALAAKNHTSIDQVIIRILQQAIEMKESSKKKRDLSGLFGTWSEEQFNEFQENTKQFQTIDKDLWE